MILLRRALALVGLLLAASAPPAHAGPLEDILYGSPSPGILRQRLHEFARTTSDPATASLAHLRRGESFSREAMTDSALACFRLAQPGGGAAAHLALADLLLRRHSETDVAETIALLESWLAATEASGDTETQSYQARLGWAFQLAGRSQDALSRLTPQSARLGTDPIWRYRLAHVAFAAGDHRASYELMLPLLIASRRQDNDLVALLGDVGRQSGRQRLLEGDVATAMDRHDAKERGWLTAMGGRRVRFPASDGEYVSAIILRAPKARRPTAAIVVMAPGDSLVNYDSLAVSLRNAGHAVMLVEPRGTGWSVSANCPLPDTWIGREELLEARVAGDIVAAYRALRTEMQLDTTRAFLAGISSMAPVVARAAQLEPRFRAIALVSPKVPWAERGRFLALLRSAGRPLFLQAGAEDRFDQAFLDSIYQTAPPRASRLAESRTVGGGVRQFGLDPGACTRLTRWVSEALSARPPKATKPR